MQRHLSGLPILGLCLLGWLIPTDVMAQEMQAQSKQEDAAFRQWVERVLSSACGKATLLVGQLPAQLPVKIPLPEKAQVVGSVVTGSTCVEIWLDASQSAAQVQAFYIQQLQASGWRKELDASDMAAAFSVPGFSNQSAERSTEALLDHTRYFCQSAQGPILLVETVSTLNQPTAVRLKLEPDYKTRFFSTCQLVFEQPTQQEARSSLTTQYEILLLPNLLLPRDTELTRQSASGGQDDYTSIVVLATKLDSQALFTHYSDQLKKAGWILIDTAQGKEQTYSTWSVKDPQGKPLQGILSFIRLKGQPNTYYGVVSIVRL
jgi:hypothetical protein